jgi:transcriptional regulator
MKRVSEQVEALAVDLRRRGITYDEIAQAIGRTPQEARKIVGRALHAHKWQGRYPELRPLSGRAANALMRLGIYTRADAARLIRSGRACSYPGIGLAVVREVCAWCGLELIEAKPGRYCVKGQMDQEELVKELEEKIRVARENLRVWRRILAELQFRTGAAPDGENYDQELQQAIDRIFEDDSDP